LFPLSHDLQLTRLIETINGKVYFPLLLIASMTTPMQGLPNFVVYLAPKFRRLKRELPNAGVLNLVKRSLGASNEADGNDDVDGDLPPAL
jgi:hypothetical protein